MDAISKTSISIVAGPHSLSRLVDRLQGRCSNGKWLRPCGGRGGRETRRFASSQKIIVRCAVTVGTIPAYIDVAGTLF